MRRSLRVMLFISVAVLPILLMSDSLYAYGNNFVATHLRTDRIEIYNSRDYRMDIKATTLPPTSAWDRSFTTAWLSVYTNPDRPVEPPGFIQVGLLAQEDGLHWFAFGYAGIECIRGGVYWEEPGTGRDWGCRGAVNDIVGLNQWHRVELVKYTHLNYWIARVYTASGYPYDVARILNPDNRVYYTEANFEEGWEELIDPELPGKFYLRNPQYYANGWQSWPKSSAFQGASAYQTQHSYLFLDRLEWNVPEEPTFCHTTWGTYGFTPDASNEWQWFAGTDGTECVWLFPPVRFDNTAASYVGNWTHATGFPKAFRTTQSWTNVGGYRVNLSTPAQYSISRVFTTAFNRGSHHTYINGNLVESNVSDYSSEIQWQTIQSWPVSSGQTTIELETLCCNYTEADAFIVDIPRANNAGLYDDRYYLFQYIGNWENADGFPDAHKSTLSWSNSDEDAVTFTFEGNRIHYYYTKAANRGWAAVSIDGGQLYLIDLYSSNTVWHASTTIPPLSEPALPWGIHTIHISATGDQHPSASDDYIDVDALCTLSLSTCNSLIE